LRGVGPARTMLASERVKKAVRVEKNRILARLLGAEEDLRGVLPRQRRLRRCCIQGEGQPAFKVNEVQPTAIEYDGISSESMVYSLG
jgi:hypothetical protein